MNQVPGEARACSDFAVLLELHTLVELDPMVAASQQIPEVGDVLRSQRVAC
jgi:hypothetical protein